MPIASLRTLLLTGSVLCFSPLTLTAQGGGQQAPTTPQQDSMRTAQRLDVAGDNVSARAMFQKLIDGAATPAATAAAQRRMALSYAFAGDCDNAARFEEMVIAYWKTREAAEPQNAFYQQGEMANEAGRICIDLGKLDTAERLYRRGSELGLREPEPKTHPRTLWEFRLAHALGRLEARRGNTAKAKQHVADARRLLDADSVMAAQQGRFYPYLVGYVALYTNDLDTAEAELTKALTMPGNTTDPFLHVLMAMVREKQGDAAAARALLQQAYDLSTNHNPPAAFARPFARKKLGTA